MKLQGTMFSSSADPQKLATTVKGILMGLVPFILLLTQKYGVTQGDLIEAVTAITGLVSAGTVLFGVGRKLYYKLK